MSSTFKVVILGEGRVGKTSLVSRFVKGEFSPTEVSTVQANMYNKKKVDIEGKKVDLSIWDTAGQERFHALGPIYYRNAAGALLVYDITDSDTFERVKNWIKELRQQVGDGIHIVICGNKGDMEKDRSVPVEKAEAYAREQQAVHFTTSAKLNMNVVEAFEALAVGVLRGATASADASPGAPKSKSKKNRVKVDLGGGGSASGPTAIATSEGNQSGSKSRKKAAVVEDNEYSAYGGGGYGGGGHDDGLGSIDYRGGGGSSYDDDGSKEEKGSRRKGGGASSSSDYHTAASYGDSAGDIYSSGGGGGGDDYTTAPTKETIETSVPSNSSNNDSAAKQPIRLDDASRQKNKDGKKKEKCKC